MRTGERTDMMKLIVAFRNFEKAAKVVQTKNKLLLRLQPSKF
jgi:flagellar basal body rod protein FlgG